MRYDRRRYSAAAVRRTNARTQGRSSREGQGLALLVVQTMLCAAALAVVFTMQYVRPQEYEALGKLYASVTGAKQNGENDMLQLLATPITPEQLKQWWEEWQPPKLAEVFARMEGQAAMGGEEPVFPRNASYQKVVVSLPAASPLGMDAVITSGYGMRVHPISGARDFHTGIDLAAAAGSSIYPVYAGTVTATGSSQSYGNYVKVRHADNLETIYCHCEKILCREGERVRTDDIIALVGSTGVSTGPHLHLSVLTGGYYVDPMNLYSR